MHAPRSARAIARDRGSVRAVARAGTLFALAWLALAALAVPCAGVRAQYQPPLKVDATTLALHWIAGRFAMPVTCRRADGSTVEVEESVTIRPAPEQGSSIFKATFFGIEVADAQRCYNLVLPELADRRGTLYITFRSMQRSDLGVRDFRLMLEDGALDYHVRDGTLRIRPVGAADEEARVVSFAGGRGELAVRVLAPTSDGWKLLSRFRGQPVARDDPRRRLEFSIQDDRTPALQGYYLETARR